MVDFSRRAILAQAAVSAIDARKFGAKADGVTDDTVALQLAIDKTPSGGGLVLPGKYVISSPLIVDKPMTITGLNQGFPVYSYDDDYTIRTSKPDIAAFVLRADDKKFPYFMGQHGVFGITFRDLKIIGYDRLKRSGSGITVDTAPYAGDLHIRGLVFDNINIRYFDTAIDLIGIAYLNNFFGVRLMQCNTGIRATRGRASDSGGQTRLYGCEIIATKTCIEWDYAGGSLSLFGCTLSESEFGLKAHENAILAIFGCEFESLKGDAKSAGIYINIKNPQNPNSDASRSIIGNKFLSSTHDIYIEKTSPAFASGVNYPVLIDGNAFGSPIALRSDPSLDQPVFVFGASNSGPGGHVADNQIVGFQGFNMARAVRKMHMPNNASRSLHLQGEGSKESILHWFDIEPGKTMHINRIERYTLNMKTGDRGSVMCQIVDGTKIVADLSGNGISEINVVNNSGKPKRYKLIANDQGFDSKYFIMMQYYFT
jgi:hypothetical protein